MAIKTSIDISKELVSVIEKKIEEELSREFDNKMKELIKRKDEIISGHILNVMSYVNFDTVGENIIITLKKDYNHPVMP